MSLLLRLLGAGLCGAIIGYERAHRFKEAGIRTHFVVAMGAALFIVISKYGFEDMIGRSGVGLDPSRVASGIVSGVGFLGAGIIFIRNQTITGLTTAAGIWVTAGIGMAIGSGLYWVGGLGTVLIYTIQMILHKHFLRVGTVPTINLKLTIAGSNAALESIQKTLNSKYQIINTKISQQNPALFIVEMKIKSQSTNDYAALLLLMKKHPDIKSIEI
ncbi:MAG: MgtC/SapB family protein [Desulfovibrio sp.]|nr:MgtC/SapB family protein [Desulfovibrio sp.]